MKPLWRIVPKGQCALSFVMSINKISLYLNHAFKFKRYWINKWLRHLGCGQFVGNGFEGRGLQWLFDHADVDKVAIEPGKNHNQQPRNQHIFLSPGSFGQQQFYQQCLGLCGAAHAIPSIRRNFRGSTWHV